MSGALVNPCSIANGFQTEATDEFCKASKMSKTFEITPTVADVDFVDTDGGTSPTGAPSSLDISFTKPPSHKWQCKAAQETSFIEIALVQSP